MSSYWLLAPITSDEKYIVNFCPWTWGEEVRNYYLMFTNFLLGIMNKFSTKVVVVVVYLVNVINATEYIGMGSFC